MGSSDLDLYPEEHYFTLTLDRLEPGWSMGVNYNLVIPGSDPVPLGQVFTNTAEVTVDLVKPIRRITSPFTSWGADRICR
jgi:hypothetical protein